MSTVKENMNKKIDALTAAEFTDLTVHNAHTSGDLYHGVAGDLPLIESETAVSMSLITALADSWHVLPADIRFGLEVVTVYARTVPGKHGIAYQAVEQYRAIAAGLQQYTTAIEAIDALIIELTEPVWLGLNPEIRYGLVTLALYTKRYSN